MLRLKKVYVFSLAVHYVNEIRSLGLRNLKRVLFFFSSILNSVAWKEPVLVLNILPRYYHLVPVN